MDFISLPLYIKQKINFYAPFSCHMFLSRFHSAVKAIVGIMHIYNTAICIEVELGGVNLRKSRNSRKFQGSLKNPKMDCISPNSSRKMITKNFKFFMCIY